MVLPFVFVHAFWSENIADVVMPKELIYQNPWQSIVKPLLFFPIDVKHLNMDADKQPQGFFVDIIAETISQHALVVVKPSDRPFIRWRT